MHFAAIGGIGDFFVKLRNVRDVEAEKTSIFDLFDLVLDH